MHTRPNAPGNPFRPTFGTTPPLLVGREVLLEEFADALDDGAGAFGRATLYGGARGVGKTVLLNAVEAEAIARGWLVVSETASDHLVQDLAGYYLPKLLAERTRRRSVRLTGLSAPGGGGATFESTDRYPVHETLRSLVTRLLESLAPKRKGLLITIDELDPAYLADLSELGVVLQHAFREDLDLAVVGAGLPSGVDALLKAPGMTFLQRASRHLLGAVAPSDVRAALEVPIRESGRLIKEPDLDRAAGATSGYPFMIQLVGHSIWRQRPSRVRITAEDVDEGIAAAQRRLGQLVHEPTLRDLSAMDTRFLLAMSADDGPSRVAEVAERLGVDANFASQYRLRLLRRQVIVARRRGYVDFALPYLREYLRRNAALLDVDGQAAGERAT